MKRIGAKPFPNNDAVIYGPSENNPPKQNLDELIKLIPTNRATKVKTAEEMLTAIYHHYDSLLPDNLTRFEIDMLHDINVLLKIEEKKR